MTLELPLEIILHIYQYVKSDITLEYFNCHVVEPKRLFKFILTDYCSSFRIKEKSKIIILEQINTTRLATIKNARLVCKSWAIGIDDVVKLSGCSFNYDSIIFNRLRQYGLSDDQYQAYRNFYNQLRIKDLRRIRLYCPFYSYGPSYWGTYSDALKFFMNRYSVPSISCKGHYDLECYSSRFNNKRLPPKYADNDKVFIWVSIHKNKTIINNNNKEKTIYPSSKLVTPKSYSQSLIPRHNKMPKMKIYGKQYHR